MGTAPRNGFTDLLAAIAVFLANGLGRHGPRQGAQSDALEAGVAFELVALASAEVTVALPPSVALLDGPGELVQVADGSAATEELAAELDPAEFDPAGAETAALDAADDSPVPDVLAGIFAGGFGGWAVSGGRTLVTSLITGELRSAIAEAPLR